MFVNGREVGIGVGCGGIYTGEVESVCYRHGLGIDLSATYYKYFFGLSAQGQGLRE